jgi:hypothetical protein
VAPAQERVLLARLEAARQVYNACLGETKRRAGLVRQSKAFHRARALPQDDPARRTLFARARAVSACSEYALHAYVDQLRQSWLGEHLDSNTCQKLATRAYQTANRLLLGKARRVRFKGRHQLDTIEGKTNTSGIRWRGDRVEWSCLVLPALIDRHDPVLAHGLACQVKYVRLVRRKLGERHHFYAQLVWGARCIASRSTTWARASWAWIWALPLSPWCRPGSALRRSAQRWRPTPKRSVGWTASSTGSGGQQP